jgi:4-nitrophenyl phosphatase
MTKVHNSLPPHLVNIRAAILDMDGVLWRGSQPIGDLADIFRRIASLGWRILLATNNATRSPEQYLERFRSYGVFLEPWQVLNSAQAAAIYLKQHYPQGGTVYVIGEEGLISALSEAGFHHSTDRPLELVPPPLAVVSAMDRGLTYEKLRTATLLIRRGAPYIATNPDVTFPTPDGLVPGAGSIVAALEASSGVKAIVMGKPAPEMYRVALERLGTTPQETLVVGDRLETDIAGGQALGYPSGLVLSGVTTLAMAHAWKPPLDIIAKDLAALVDLWAKQEV